MKFKGIMPAFVTPLNTDNSTINEDVTKELLKYHLSIGADGFYICGGTGEGLVLDLNEREKICELIIKEVKGEKPIINHVASMNFNDTVRLAKHAEKAGGMRLLQCRRFISDMTMMKFIIIIKNWRIVFQSLL